MTGFSMMPDGTATVFGKRAFWLAIVINMVWINASEIFRYFVFVMPMMRAALPGVGDVAPMNLAVFASWGVWDTILVVVATTTSWLAFERYGASRAAALAAGTALWLAVFVILWLGLYNMNLATGEIILIALPLAWLELVVAAFVVRWCWARL